MPRRRCWARWKAGSWVLWAGRLKGGISTSKGMVTNMRGEVSMRGSPAVDSHYASCASEEELAGRGPAPCEANRIQEGDGVTQSDALTSERPTRLMGTRGSQLAYAIRDFLQRSDVPFEWI